MVLNALTLPGSVATLQAETVYFNGLFIGLKQTLGIAVVEFRKAQYYLHYSSRYMTIISTVHQPSTRKYLQMARILFLKIKI